MSTHKAHLYAEPLSPEVITVIEGLQAWLMEAKFNPFAMSLGDISCQYEVCESDDRRDKWDLIADAMGVDIEVFHVDPRKGNI